MSVEERINELKKIGGLKNNDRYFKVGDVIRFVGAHHTSESTEEKGVGVVVSVKGPIFETYWVGNGKIGEGDARCPGVYKLQDFAPIPQVANWLENKS